MYYIFDTQVLLLSLPLLGLYWLITILHRRQSGQRINWLRMIFVTALLLDVFYILWNTVLFDTLFRTVAFIGNINLVPLIGIYKMAKAIIESENFWSIINLFGNIFLFTPFGMLVAFLYPKTRRLWKILLMGFAFSLLIETWQLFLPRSFDVDDLILNIFGTGIGYLLFLILRWLFPKLTQKLNQ
jgi:glycopeptide antibiotics resistance protein